jgi:alpha-L-rhamnosidase
MGDTALEKRYEKLTEKLIEVISDRFWGVSTDDQINKQTLFATLLYHRIIPESERKIARDSLLAALSLPRGHFTTGIFGTKYILESLSETGNAETVYRIVNDTSFPGWGYMIDRGATTIWETWKESDNTYSNCHPMFGSVSEWFYRWLAGIRPDPDYPGFKRFIINPILPDGLTHVSSSYHSPNGEIVSNWKKHGNGKQEYKIVIPEGSLAKVKLPAGEKQKLKFTKNSSGRFFVPERIDDKHFSFELPPGSYSILIHL